MGWDNTVYPVMPWDVNANVVAIWDAAAPAAGDWNDTDGMYLGECFLEDNSYLTA